MFQTETVKFQYMDPRNVLFKRNSRMCEDGGRKGRREAGTFFNASLTAAAQWTAKLVVLRISGYLMAIFISPRRPL